MSAAEVLASLQQYVPYVQKHSAARKGYVVGMRRKNKRDELDEVHTYLHAPSARIAVAALIARVDALEAENRALRDMPFVRTGTFDRNGRGILAGDRVLYIGKSKHTKREYWFPEYIVEWRAPRFRLSYAGGDKDNSSAHFAFEHTHDDSWRAELEVIDAARAEAGSHG